MTALLIPGDRVRVLTGPGGTRGFTGDGGPATSAQLRAAGGVAVDAAYAGSRGVHLPGGNQNLNALPTNYLSLGTGLNTQVANPFYGLVKTGTLSQPTRRRPAAAVAKQEALVNARFHLFRQALGRSGATLTRAKPPRRPRDRRHGRADPQADRE